MTRKMCRLGTQIERCLSESLDKKAALEDCEDDVVVKGIATVRKTAKPGNPVTKQPSKTTQKGSVTEDFDFDDELEPAARAGVAVKKSTAHHTTAKHTVKTTKVSVKAATKPKPKPIAKKPFKKSFSDDFNMDLEHIFRRIVGTGKKPVTAGKPVTKLPSKTTQKASVTDDMDFDDEEVKRFARAAVTGKKTVKPGKPVTQQPSKTTQKGSVTEDFDFDDELEPAARAGVAVKKSTAHHTTAKHTVKTTKVSVKAATKRKPKPIAKKPFKKNFSDDFDFDFEEDVFIRAAVSAKHTTKQPAKTTKHVSKTTKKAATPIVQKIKPVVAKKPVKKLFPNYHV